MGLYLNQTKVFHSGTEGIVFLNTAAMRRSGLVGLACMMTGYLSRALTLWASPFLSVLCGGLVVVHAAVWELVCVVPSCHRAQTKKASPTMLVHDSASPFLYVHSIQTSSLSIQIDKYETVIVHANLTNPDLLTQEEVLAATVGI